MDGHGRLHLPGARRSLPAATGLALAEDAAAGDASVVLWRVLLGVVRARWRCQDLIPLLAGSSGLEHVRTQRTGLGQRRPRTPAQASAVLARHWDRAVTWTATHPQALREEDPTFQTRCALVVAAVDHVQTRADAAAGRWARAAGPAHRRVLDALSSLCLAAVTDTVEADIRRLALLCGIGRETARTALHALAADGWITRHRAAHGPHGAVWSITTQHSEPGTPSSTIDAADDRSQAVTRPLTHLSSPAEDRAARREFLDGRLRLQRHDIFTGSSPGLGHHAARIYAGLHTGCSSVMRLARDLGYTTTDVLHYAAALIDDGLAAWASHGLAATIHQDGDPRDAAAHSRGVHGRLASRAATYQLERMSWAWWTAELAWMHAPRRPGAARRAGHGQLALVIDGTVPPPRHGPHPRRPDGRADYRAARRHLQSTATTTTPSLPKELAA